MKRMGTLLTLIFLSLICQAPEQRTLLAERIEPIRPYENVWKAVCMVESSGNPLAYHMEKNGHASIGIAQIQESRIKDFNKRTGKNYKLADMYDPAKSKDVFLHYATGIGYRNPERICRLWNGGEPNGMKIKETYRYWLKVQKVYLSL